MSNCSENATEMLFTEPPHKISAGTNTTLPDYAIASHALLQTHDMQPLEKKKVRLCNIRVIDPRQI